MTETETMSFLGAIGQGLREEMERDERVFVMGEDVGYDVGGMFGVTSELSSEFGEQRVRNTPISEAGFVGAAVGAAATGSRPVVEIGFSTFLGVAFEQVNNQLTLMRYMFGGKTDLPVVIRAVEGGGKNAAAQHSKTLHTVYAHLPGAKVVAPGTPAAAKGLTKAAIRSEDPVFFFEDKSIYRETGEVPVNDDFTVPLGKASVEVDGDDVTVVATNRFVPMAEAVASDLREDISVEVIDLRSLYPLDHETVAKSLRKTGRLVVADESPMTYGTHAEIITRMTESEFFSLDLPPQRVGVPDTPIPFGPSMEDEVVPDEEDLQRAIQRLR